MKRNISDELGTYVRRSVDNYALTMLAKADHTNNKPNEVSMFLRQADHRLNVSKPQLKGLHMNMSLSVYVFPSLILPWLYGLFVKLVEEHACQTQSGWPFKGYKNVNVSVYSLKSPLSSADFTIYAPGIGTLSYTVSSPLGRIQHLRTLLQL